MTGVTKSSRSGGPKTPAGKAVASRNSLKTGSYSSLVVLPGENEEEFRELEAQFQADFQASGIVEASMVHELAVLIWKRMRLERLERQYLISELSRNPSVHDFRAVGLDFPTSTECYLSDPEELEGLDLKEYTDFYYKVKKLKVAGATPRALSVLRRFNTELFGQLVDEAIVFGIPNPTNEQLCTEWCERSGEKTLLINWLIKEFFVRMDPLVWIHENEAAIMAARERIRDKRLFKLLQADGVGRVHDDLARSISRVLTELRKQQAWRAKNQVIDVAAVAQVAQKSAK